jgi:hypothetical protein
MITTARTNNLPLIEAVRELVLRNIFGAKWEQVPRAWREIYN